jgi:hypothetical protein
MCGNASALMPGLDLCVPVRWRLGNEVAAASRDTVRVEVKTWVSKSAQTRAHTQAEATTGGEAASDRKHPNVGHKRPAVGRSA